MGRVSLVLLLLLVGLLGLFSWSNARADEVCLKSLGAVHPVTTTLGIIRDAAENVSALGRMMEEREENAGLHYDLSKNDNLEPQSSDVLSAKVSFKVAPDSGPKSDIISELPYDELLRIVITFDRSKLLSTSGVYCFKIEFSLLSHFSYESVSGSKTYGVLDIYSSSQNLDSYGQNVYKSFLRELQKSWN